MGFFAGLLSPRNVLIKTKKSQWTPLPHTCVGPDKVGKQEASQQLHTSWGHHTRKFPLFTHQMLKIDLHKRLCSLELTNTFGEDHPSPCHIPSPWIIFSPSSCSFVKSCFFCHKLGFMRCFWEHPAYLNTMRTFWGLKMFHKHLLISCLCK